MKSHANLRGCDGLYSRAELVSISFQEDFQLRQQVERDEGGEKVATIEPRNGCTAERTETR
jgi:hypothetical protein